MGRRIDEAVWSDRKELLQRQALSGMSVAGFCREHGVNLWNFHAWKRKLGGDEAAGSRGRSQNMAGTVAGGSGSFVRVALPAIPEMNATTSSWIEVSTAAGLVIRVPSSNLAALRVVLGNFSREHGDD